MPLRGTTGDEKWCAGAVGWGRTVRVTRSGIAGAASPRPSWTRVPRGTTDCCARWGARRPESGRGGTPPGRHTEAEETAMQVVHERCGGLDVHKKTVVACVLSPGADGQPAAEIRTYATMTADLEQ